MAPKATAAALMDMAAEAPEEAGLAEAEAEAEADLLAEEAPVVAALVAEAAEAAAAAVPVTEVLLVGTAAAEAPLTMAKGSMLVAGN